MAGFGEGIRFRSRLLTAVLAGAALAASPIDWVRQGNAAFGRGEFAEAIHYYERAEALATDPGLVAYNLAGAHYELGHFVEAGQCYRRALEDADGPRRVRALYGLGNALARQGQTLRGRAAVQRLSDARTAYDACLAMESQADEQTQSSCADTFADARFNRRLVDLLLERKRNEAAQEPPGADADSGPKPGNDGKTERGTRPGDAEPDTTKRGTPADQGNEGGSGKGKPQTGDPLPGKGNLPLLPDDRDAPSLDAGAAREHLQAALDRIRKGRAEHMTAPPSGVSRVKDW
jgi:tetratricopeptide (TPR) repeat protein